MKETYIGMRGTVFNAFDQRIFWNIGDLIVILQQDIW